MMELMFLRPPGLRPPDDASGAAVAAAGDRREVLVCVH